MNNKVSIWWFLVLFIIFFAILKQCEGKPTVTTVTETKIVTVHDTITEVKIKEVPKTVYVEKIKTVKGKDTIIYKDSSSDSTITAKQYQTTLKSNEASAELKITTSGELLDVSGIITYPEKETTTTITKIRNASGLFIYGNSAISATGISPGVGALFNIKNKLILGAGVEYNNFTNNVNATFTLGVKIW